MFFKLNNKFFNADNFDVIKLSFRFMYTNRINYVNSCGIELKLTKLCDEKTPDITETYQYTFTEEEVHSVGLKLDSICFPSSTNILSKESKAIQDTYNEILQQEISRRISDGMTVIDIPFITRVILDKLINDRGARFDNE